LHIGKSGKTTMVMNFGSLIRIAMGLALVAGIGPAALAQTPSPAAEAPFIAENTAAMDKMMADMNVKPTGDVDRDFVAMMIPHHQGAIEMARSLLRYGHNEQLRRLAQEIIVTQQQEIVTMRLAVGEPLPPATAAPTAPASDPATMPDHTSHNSMHMKQE
jgi:Domain of unknown function (DUF305)